MAITSSSATSTGSTSATSTSTSAAQQASDRFLKILLTELQNQNPLDPVSTKDYTSQLAQYSSLEQAINTNTKLDSILSAIAGTSTGNLSPTAYLGNTVDFDSATTVVQNGSATWTYSTTDASAVTIKVTDADGNTVYTGTGDATSGTHTFALTASDTTINGAQLTITITATDSDGKSVTPTVYSRATVDAVDSSTGTTMLEASGYSFAASKVVRVAAPSTATSTSTSTSSSSS